MTSLSPFSETYSPRYKTPQQDSHPRSSPTSFTRKSLSTESSVTPSSERDTVDSCDSSYEDLVYLPVEVDMNKLRDWHDPNSKKSEDAKKGELVSVNSTEVAMFK